MSNSATPPKNQKGHFDTYDTNGHVYIDLRPQTAPLPDLKTLQAFNSNATKVGIFYVKTPEEALLSPICMHPGRIVETLERARLVAEKRSRVAGPSQKWQQIIKVLPEEFEFHTIIAEHRIHFGWMASNFLNSTTETLVDWNNLSPSTPHSDIADRISRARDLLSRNGLELPMFPELI